MLDVNLSTAEAAMRQASMTAARHSAPCASVPRAPARYLDGRLLRLRASHPYRGCRTSSRSRSEMTLTAEYAWLPVTALDRRGWRWLMLW